MVAAVRVASAHESTAWKLLVFHCQSLGILLYTQTALPPLLISFVSVVSSGSGFSFSSLVAVECVTKWELPQQLWQAAAWPAALLALAVLA